MLPQTSMPQAAGQARRAALEPRAPHPSWRFAPPHYRVAAADSFSRRQDWSLNNPDPPPQPPAARVRRYYAHPNPPHFYICAYGTLRKGTGGLSMWGFPSGAPGDTSPAWGPVIAGRDPSSPKGLGVRPPPPPTGSMTPLPTPCSRITLPRGGTDMWIRQGRGRGTEVWGPAAATLEGDPPRPRHQRHRPQPSRPGPCIFISQTRWRKSSQRIFDAFSQSFPS